MQQFSTWFSKQKFAGKLAIGCGGLFLLLCLCSISTALFNPSTPPSEKANVSSVQTTVFETALAGANQTAIVMASTNTPEFTKIPESTNTPAPSDTPLPPPTMNVGMIGERRESGGIALTVLGVSKMQSIDYFTPESGNVFLVMEVVIENVSRDDETPYNPLYFSVKDSDGFEANTSFASPNPSLQSGDLPKGDKVRGYVAFEVRSSASGFVATYEPLVIFGGYEPIRINLGQ